MKALDFIEQYLFKIQQRKELPKFGDRTKRVSWFWVLLPLSKSSVIYFLLTNRFTKKRALKRWPSFHWHHLLNWKHYNLITASKP